MRELVVVCVMGLNAFAASPIIFGVRGGVPLTNTFGNVTSNLGLTSPSQQFIVGPTVGLHLPLGFSVEGDALFNRETLSVGQFAGLNALSTHADSWQFPMMLKFTAGSRAIAPVLGAGFSIRHFNNFGGLPSILLTGSTSANSVGFVAGGGLQFKAGPVAITPEVRYTRWSGSGLAESLLDTFSSNRNQAQVLVGFTF